MATDIAAATNSATSPKLVKKNSLADIRYPFPAMQKLAGCGMSASLPILTLNGEGENVNLTLCVCE